MTKSLSAIAALLLATAILYTGNGLQSTLLSVRANLEGFPTALIGMMMSAYFVGFIVGCRTVPGLIKSSGHIRTFVALASVASASALAHSLIINFPAWACLRIITGFCFAGLAMVLESWINERATNQNRGRLLSVYRIVDLSALTIGNGLLTIASPSGFELFALVSILVSLALVPVALTRSDAPGPIIEARLDIPRLISISPVAAAGALATGLANASFWAMGPVFVQKIGYGAETVAIFMSAVIIGAAVFQWPLGWLSDRIDRRFVLTATSLLGVSASLMLMKFGAQGQTHLLIWGFIWGGFILPTFGLSVAHANDHAAQGTAVATNGGLFLLHGSGAIIGASLGALVMSVAGASTLFSYIALIYGCFAVICIVRIFARPAVPTAQKSAFVPVAKAATPSLFDIAEDDNLPKADRPPSQTPDA